jgi:hypothetical protein
MLEKKIAELFLSQRYQYSRRPTDHYSFEFIQGLCWRRIKINGDPILKFTKLYQGNEIWTTLCRPWLNYAISNTELVNIIKFIGKEKNQKTVKDNNVIRPPNQFWSKSTENQSDF